MSIRLEYVFDLYLLLNGYFGINLRVILDWFEGEVSEIDGFGIALAL